MMLLRRKKSLWRSRPSFLLVGGNNSEERPDVRLNECRTTLQDAGEAGYFQEKIHRIQKENDG